jgi:hypothetical protein
MQGAKVGFLTVDSCLVVYCVCLSFEKLVQNSSEVTLRYQILKYDLALNLFMYERDWLCFNLNSKSTSCSLLEGSSLSELRTTYDMVL